MRQRHRVVVPRLCMALAVAGLLVTAPAFPSGFQVMTHGARASGMGLAYAGVGGDPTAIFFNPAGIAWMNQVEGYVGLELPDPDGRPGRWRQPVPRRGRHRVRRSRTGTSSPTATLVLPLTQELNVGVGGFAQYGLGLKWEDPNTTYNGQFISQNAVIQSLDTNLVFSYKLFPQLAIAAGVDYRFSKVQLERNQGAINPFTGSIVPVAHVKLNSELLSNGGWGWNAGLMFKPVEAISIGAAYRSSINIDYEGEATFTQRPTGNAVLDALVAALAADGQPSGRDPIDFPSSINLGPRHPAAGRLPPRAGGGLDGVVDLPEPGHHVPDARRRATSCGSRTGQDTWAYRAGLEKCFGRVGDPRRVLLRQLAAARLRRQPASSRCGPQRLHGRLRLQHAAMGLRRRRPLDHVQGSGDPHAAADRQLLRHVLRDRPRPDGRHPVGPLGWREP